MRPKKQRSPSASPAASCARERGAPSVVERRLLLAAKAAATRCSAVAGTLPGALRTPQQQSALHNRFVCRVRSDSALYPAGALQLDEARHVVPPLRRCRIQSEERGTEDSGSPQRVGRRSSARLPSGEVSCTADRRPLAVRPAARTLRVRARRVPRAASATRTHDAAPHGPAPSRPPPRFSSALSWRPPATVRPRSGGSVAV
jgi:hypothetical protein